MKIAIMQPYFFPYIGYFQLMNSVDEFVVYDNIEYTKKGWINRNRILVNGKDDFITLPIKKDSDYLDVRERYLADNWPEHKMKMLNRIDASYRKAPFFKEVNPLLEECLSYENNNLFQFIYHSLSETRRFLGITSTLVVSSGINIDHTLKAESKVMALCKERKATDYINPIGGVNLYSKKKFTGEGISLHFLKSGEFSYRQFDNDFVPWLSIIDVMMFLPVEKIKNYLDTGYTLI